MFVRIAKKNRVTQPGSYVLNGTGNPGEKKVGYVRNDDPYHPRFAATQTLGRHVGSVIHLDGDGPDVFGGLFSHAMLACLVVKYERNQRGGNSRFFSYIF